MFSLRSLFSGSTPPYRWAIIHMNGRTTLHGKVLDQGRFVHVVTFDTEAEDGSMLEASSPPSAFHRIEYRPEDDVRRLFAEEQAPANWSARPCSTFKPSRVSAPTCCNCGKSAAKHAEEVKRQLYVSNMVEKIAAALGCARDDIDLYDEEGDDWSGKGPIHNMFIHPNGSRGRDATQEERDLCRAAGVPVMSESTKSDNKDIPF